MTGTGWAGAVARRLPLAICAILAARQSVRARRAIREGRAPEPAPLPDPPPRVSIVVPLRDEEENVDALLSSLLAQDYPDIELIVVDDGSTDRTPELLAAWTARDARVRVERVEELPPGWAGKAHALHRGVGLASGEWVLFTDADGRQHPNTIGIAVGHALRHGVDLLSLLPRLAFIGAGMKLLTPAATLTLVERATPGEIRDPHYRRPWATAWISGGFILLRRAAYEATGGYDNPKLRASFADDVRLAELVKGDGYRLDLADGRDLLAIRQYETWGTVWRGWRKSAYGDFYDRPLVGLAGGVALLMFGALPPLLGLRGLLRRRPDEALMAVGVWALQASAFAPYDREFGITRLWSLLAPLSWVLLGVLTLDATRLAISGRGATWKGRAGAAPEPGAAEGMSERH